MKFTCFLRESVSFPCQMRKREYISLDSDDDDGADITVNSKKARFSENPVIIDLLSEDEDEVPVNSSNPATISTAEQSIPVRDENLREGDIGTEKVKSFEKRASDINGMIDEDESNLTPQQLLRKRSADAAERRIKQAKDKSNKSPETAESVVSIESHGTPDSKKIPQLTPSVSFPGRNIPPRILHSCIDDASSRIRIIKNPGYCSEYQPNADTDAVSLHELVGSDQLVKSYQFNMLIDFDYFSKFIRAKNCEFILISNGEKHLNVSDNSWEKFRIRAVDVTNKLLAKGTHHSKMMVNFFNDTTCQIVIHTMNLIESDHILRTQMCWISPVLRLHESREKYLDFMDPNISLSSDTGTCFKRDFISYLFTYENPDINKLVDLLGTYDFSPIDVVFVGSSPGHFEYRDKLSICKPNSKPMFGYGRLWQVIHILKLESLSGKLIGQSSALAGPCDDWKRNELVHVLTSCVEKGYPLAKRSSYVYDSNQKLKVEPVIIWPTVKEVLNSRGGPLAGSSLFLTKEGKWPSYKRQFDEIKRYLHRWSTFNDSPRHSKSGRSNLMPHVKTYTLTEDNFKTIKWFLLTSANISKQAWGQPNFKSKEYSVIQYDISSFEAGVFIDPKLLKTTNNHENKRQILVPTLGKDSIEDNEDLSSGATYKIGIRLPYDLPLAKYQEGKDQVWTQDDALRYLKEYE